MPVSEVRRGECLGEVSLLEPGPAAATIRVVEDAVLWDLDITGLRIYISDHSGGAGALLMGMASCLSARLREANRHICPAPHPAGGNIARRPRARHHRQQRAHPARLLRPHQEVLRRRQ